MFCVKYFFTIFYFIPQLHSCLSGNLLLCYLLKFYWLFFGNLLILKAVVSDSLLVVGSGDFALGEFVTKTFKILLIFLFQYWILLCTISILVLQVLPLRSI